MKSWNRFNLLHARRIGLALIFLTSTQATHADTPEICVSNDTDLISALSQAQANAVTIALVQNTYHLNQTVWNAKLSPSATGKMRPGSSLLGGYTANCASRDIAVGNTVVTDTTTTPDDEVNILGDATIEGITFTLANGLLIAADADENNPLASGSQLTIRRNVFTQTTGATAEPLEIYWNEDSSIGGTVRLVNNLIHDNTGGSGTSDAAAIFFQINSGKPTIEMINNTVVDNTGSLGGFGLLNTATVPVYAYNNIFYGNAGKDFAVNFGNQITLVDNVIGTHAYATPANAPSGTTSGDPKLDGNFKPIESPPSPVINTGSNSVIGGLPSTDLPGRARTVGSVPDRGAFESSINDSPILNVTNANDSGVGSLRAAILSANANGPSGGLIFFNIGSTCGPSVITLQTALPNITTAVAIAGYSQPGAAVNDLDSGDDATICIILDGSAHNLSDGLMVAPGAPAAANLVVNGMAFGGFSHAAISLYGSSGHIVNGTHIGGAVGGTSLAAVGNGIVIGPGVSGVTIGGDDISERNIIGDATGDGVVIDGANGSYGAAHDNQILHNFVGLGWSTAGSGSFTNRGNGNNGIVVAGSGNTIQSNYIEYNGGYGIELTGTDANTNYVASNFVGYLVSYTNTGSGNLGGIVVENDAHDNQINYNEAWFNSGTGIRVVNGQNNSIFDDSTNGNGGLGIDLAGAGVTPNDNDSDPQAADYANKGLNFPVITGAIGGNEKGVISGTLTTTPGTYEVQFYASQSCNPSGYGEGEYVIGGTQVVVPSNAVVNGQATASFSATSSENGFVFAPIITVVAIDSTGNTSEFSKCFTYVNDTIFANSFEAQ